jgi:pimeloyl-ACP methyl ester carboxylesterase
MERIADDGAALLDHLGIAKAVVGGCSMGGYAAFAFVRRHPQRLAGLVLQDTRAGADDAEGKANRATLAAKVLADGAPAAVEAFLPKLVGKTSHGERPALVAGLRERILATSPKGIANALHGLAARADSRDTLPTIAVPTLVVVGAEDVLTPPAEAATMAAAIPRARLDVVPRAGHLANIENPDAVNTALRAFLARVGP